MRPYPVNATSTSVMRVAVALQLERIASVKSTTDAEKLNKIKVLDAWLRDYVSDLSTNYGSGSTTFGQDAIELIRAILHDEKLDWDTNNSLYILIREYAAED